MDFLEELAGIEGLALKREEPMKKHTTAGLGGNARIYAEAESLYSLSSALNAAKRHAAKCKVVGNGSNLLVSDEGFDGLIISAARLKDAFITKDGLRVGAGLTLSALTQFALRLGLGGAEELVGIPGTVGGAIKTNAGAFGKSVSDILVSAEVLTDGKIEKRKAEELSFGYRKSGLKKGETVVAATFGLYSAKPSEIEKRRAEFISLRRAKQPQGRSFGSTFKNPKRVKCEEIKRLGAGAIIEKAGLKGFSFGGASVSHKHANFITLSSSATAKEVKTLIEGIKTRVYEKFGVKLSEEVEYVGEF